MQEREISDLESQLSSSTDSTDITAVKMAYALLKYTTFEDDRVEEAWIIADAAKGSASIGKGGKPRNG